MAPLVSTIALEVTSGTVLNYDSGVAPNLSVVTTKNLECGDNRQAMRFSDKALYFGLIMN